jgi:chromosome segregation ATPase
LIVAQRRHLQFEIDRAERRAGELREHLESEQQDPASLQAELAKLSGPKSELNSAG